MKWGKGAMMRKVLMRIVLISLLITLVIPSVSLLAEDTPQPGSNPSENISQENGSLSKGAVKFAFAGDFLLERRAEALIAKYGKGFILSETKSVFQDADISMVNLECPVSIRGVKEKDKQFTFRANPKHVSLLKDGGIDLVTLANNHALDYGQDALLDTFNHLKKEKIPYVGAGVNADHAYAPLYMDCNGNKVAILAASRVLPFGTWYAGKNKPGIASTYDPSVIRSEIAKARKTADIVAVYVHWGQERKDKPDRNQTRLAKLYVDCGADIVIGSHPHVLQGLEFYKGKIIAYSMGNFVFTDVRKDTMMLTVTVEDKKIKEVKIIPCEIQNYRPVIMKDLNKKKALMAKMRNLSFNTRIDSEGIAKSTAGGE